MSARAARAFAAGRTGAGACTCVVLLALVPLARAQAPEPQPVVEGPPDTEVLLEGSSRALDRLIAGDRAWNEGQREGAFDAWRDALVASRSESIVGLDGVLVAPPPRARSDPDGTLARRAEDAHHTVRRRLADLGVAESEAWRARFGPLAEFELVAAGDSEFHLTRVAREFPLTRAAARAALRLADLAAERGHMRDAALHAGRALLDVERNDDALQAAVVLRSALVLRTALVPRGSVASGTRVPPAATTNSPAAELQLSLERTIVLGVARDARDTTIPGLAFAIEDDASFAGDDTLVSDFGATWHHANGRLLGFDGEGRATAALDIAAALLALGVEAGTAFSEVGAPWDERLAVSDRHLALVVGRARESRGNALVGVDARATPRIAWARDSDTFVRDGVRLESPSLTGAKALLEFQPGPLVVGDVLVVHVRAWSVGTETVDELDEARAESWCAGFDPRDGTLRWSRRLATGATARGMDRGRMEPPEPTSWPALPPIRAEAGLIAIDTGLGAIACVEALDGRVAWIVRTSRRNTRPTAAGGWIAGDTQLWAAPAAAEGALLRVLAGPDVGSGLFVAAPLVLESARIPFALARGSDSTWLAWTQGSGGVALLRQDLVNGRESRSAVLPFATLERGSIAAAELGRAWVASAGGRAWILDLELRVRADIEIGPRSAFPRVSAIARQGPSGAEWIRIAGPNSLAFLVSR